MAETFETKKHPATQLRRRRASEQGVFPRSQEWTVALTWLLGIAVLQWGTPYTFELFSGLVSERLGGLGRVVGSGEAEAQGWYLGLIGCVLRGFAACSPLLLGMFLVALAVHFAQAGFRFNPERLAWDSNRLAPRLPRLGDPEGLATILRGCIKMMLVAVVFGGGIWGRMEELVSWSDLPLDRGLGAAWGFLLGLGWYLGLGWLVLAILDYGWNWWQYELGLRMTDTELREELKESQGDAGIRGRRRKLVSGG